MAVPMLLACLWIAWRGQSRPLRVVAVWLAGLLAYLFLILLPKFLDRNSGALGKFYLFRPSSLILLLWLMLVLAASVAAVGGRAWVLRGSSAGADRPGLPVFPGRAAGARYRCERGAGA